MAKPVILNFGRDIQGFNANAPGPCVTNFNAVLASGTAASITVPTDYTNWIVKIGCQQATQVYMDATTTAVAPSTGSFVASTAEMVSFSDPIWKRVTTFQQDGKTATVLSFITDSTTAEVSVSFYADPSPH